MDQLLWRRTLATTFSPHWPCPACKGGTLALVPKSLVFRETEESRKDRASEDFEPDWIKYAFNAWVKCANPKCGQECVVSGVGGVEPEYDEEDGMGWADYFAPRYLFPMPDVIRIPTKCPDAVSRSLRASFAVMWSDQKGAANHIRSALEHLLDQLGIQHRRKTKKGTFMDLSLHARIEIYNKSQPAIGRSLMALKWVGNSGSHGAQVTLDEILDAYEILEHALEEVIEERSQRVAALAEKITKKHGRRKR